MKLKTFITIKTIICLVLALLLGLGNIQPAYAGTSPSLRAESNPAYAGSLTIPVELTYALPTPVSPVFTYRQTEDPDPVPAGWSGAYLYRVTGVKEDRASFGALKNITKLTKGKLTLSLDGFAGLTLRLSVPVAAILTGYYYEAFDQFTIGLHAGASVSGGQPTGLVFGVSGNLRF